MSKNLTPEEITNIITGCLFNRLENFTEKQYPLSDNGNMKKYFAKADFYKNMIEKMDFRDIQDKITSFCYTMYKRTSWEKEVENKEKITIDDLFDDYQVEFFEDYGYFYKISGTLKVSVDFLRHLVKEKEDMVIELFKNELHLNGCNIASISKINKIDNTVKILVKESFNKFILNMDADYMKTDISVCGLSKKTCNCLKRSGIYTVGDLIKKTEKSEWEWDLLCIRGFGFTALDEVEVWLTDFYKKNCKNE